jgi:hypothetical protein
MRSFHRLYWGAAAAVLVAFVVFASVRTGWKESAAQVAAAATRFDSTAAKQPSHQSFRVELSREGGQQNPPTAKLEVWSDPASGRYSAQLRQGGKLVFAAWKPKPGEEYWHGASPGATPLRLASIAIRPAASSDLEELLVRWLASRRWQPVSIAGEISHFLSQDGVTLRAERFRAAEESILRLIARRQAGGISATLTAEFAQSDYRPKLLRLRVEDASGAVEIRLAAERIESGREVKFADAVFKPEREGVHSAGKSRVLAPELQLRREQPAFTAAPAWRSISSREIAERELAVRYALHRIGACLGEPIHIDVAADGLVTVTGLAEQESRRQELHNAVQKLGYVRLNVQTVADALSVNASDHPNPADAPGPTRVAGRKAPIEERLEAYFRRSSGESDIPRRISALSNRATVATAEMLAHAWAVRRLREAYPPERIALLPPQSGWILEDILGDHLEAIRENADRALDLLQPVLGAATDAVPIQSLHAGFDGAVKDVFQWATAADRLCRGVFGVSGLNRDEESQATSSLLENLARVRHGTIGARTAAAAEFGNAANHDEPRRARNDTPATSKEK